MTGRGWPRWLAFAILTAQLGWSHGVAASEPRIAKRKVQRRHVKFERDRGWVVLTVGWRDVVTKAVARKLTNGLPTVITSRTYLFADSGGKAIALNARTCRIVFDLWDEVFRVEVRQAGSARKTVAANVEGVLRRCAEARRVSIVKAKALRANTAYFTGVLVEVNPLSDKMLRRIKRWVARPKGAGAAGAGDSLFGSFVGLFVTRVPKADRVLVFRSQSFKVGSLPLRKRRKRKRASARR